MAGGCHLALTPDAFVGFSKMGALSPEGVSRSYDNAASGFARGEGVGLVFLKRLDDAERDGDRIYAVIRSSATNQDGKMKGGITMPSTDAQMMLLDQVYKQGDVHPNDVFFSEQPEFSI